MILDTAWKNTGNKLIQAFSLYGSLPLKRIRRFGNANTLNTWHVGNARIFTAALVAITQF